MSIAVLLVFLTALLVRRTEQARQADSGSSAPSEAADNRYILPEIPGGEEKEGKQDSTVSSVPAAAVPEKPKPVRKGTLVFVIDDVGNSLEQLNRFLKIPGPLVFAVMPDRRYSSEAVKRIQAAGKTAILHQPMQPVGSSDPGPGAILSGMTRDEIRSILDANLRSVGPVEGLNNHMGSRVTTDRETMTIILEYLKEKNMFFLDSATNNGLVGGEISKTLGLPYLKRNSMFLDNDSDREKVLNAIKEGQNIAERKGHAIMIGHVMTDSLAELLLELYPTFMEDGFSVKDLSDLLHGEYDVSSWD